jgi:tRNA(adenine34) deaminase
VMRSHSLTPQFVAELMSCALMEAEKAASLGEVPVGAVIAVGDKIICATHNLSEKLTDASAHAEMLAIREASKRIGNWRLDQATLCVTMEPCTMCVGAIKLSRIATVIYGCADPRAGAAGSLYDVLQDSRSGPAPRVVSGIESGKCAKVLQEFFRKRRGE